MQAIKPDFINFVTGFETLSVAWKGLLNQYDKDISFNSIHLFQQLIELRMSSNSSLREHFDTFHQSWKRMFSRCNSSSKPVAAALRNTFASDEVKGYFFFSTLPDTYDNVVDNLISKDLTGYGQVEAKMLDLVDKHSNTDMPESVTAYWTQTSRNCPNECIYCKACNLLYSGHIHINYNILKKNKKNTTKNQQLEEKIKELTPPKKPLTTVIHCLKTVKLSPLQLFLLMILILSNLLL